MAMKQDVKLKENIKRIEELLRMRGDSKDSGSKLIDMFYEDMRDFILYISCADGFISEKDSEFLECYTGFYLTTNEMVNRIRYENINSLKYSHKITDFMKKIMDIETRIYEKNEDNYGTCIECILLIYLLLGVRLIKENSDDFEKGFIYAAQYVQNISDIINSIMPKQINIFEEDTETIDYSKGRIAPARDYDMDEDESHFDIDASGLIDVEESEFNPDDYDEDSEENTESAGDEANYEEYENDPVISALKKTVDLFAEMFVDIAEAISDDHPSKEVFKEQDAKELFVGEIGLFLIGLMREVHDCATEEETRFFNYITNKNYTKEFLTKLQNVDELKINDVMDEVPASVQLVFAFEKKVIEQEKELSGMAEKLKELYEGLGDAIIKINNRDNIDQKLLLMKYINRIADFISDDADKSDWVPVKAPKKSTEQEVKIIKAPKKG